MFRKRYLHGCCAACFGAGLILGHSLESWFACCIGGAVLIVLGICTMGKA